MWGACHCGLVGVGVWVAWHCACEVAGVHEIVHVCAGGSSDMCVCVQDAALIGAGGLRVGQRGLCGGCVWPGGGMWAIMGLCAQGR